MSLLIFELRPEAVMVLTDTLATTGDEDKTPLLFNSKCAVVPHLEMAIAFTGVALVGHKWAHKVQTDMLARDIDMLDQHTPAVLRSVTNEIEAEFGALGSTTTIYHLGFSEEAQEYRGYAYRSKNDYDSVPLAPGLHVKPPWIDPIDPTKEMGIEGIVRLGIQIRAEQDAIVDVEKRVHIGCDLVGTFLYDRVIQIQKLHRFDDFEDQWLEMNRRLAAE